MNRTCNNTCNKKPIKDKLTTGCSLFPYPRDNLQVKVTILLKASPVVFRFLSFYHLLQAVVESLRI